MTLQVLVDDHGNICQWQDTDRFGYAEPSDGYTTMPVTQEQWAQKDNLKWVRDGVLTDVASPVPQLKPPPKTQFSVREFRQRFTLSEQVAIRAASMTDMEVGLVYDDFQSAQYIDVTDPDVGAGIDLYISKSLLDPGRKAELLAPEAE